MHFLNTDAEELARIIEVSRGIRDADAYIRGGTVINVYSGELIKANVAICGDQIAYVGLSEDAIGDETEIIDANGYYLCPGYVEAHGHPWVIYNPVELCKAMLALGTTTFFSDSLFFFNLLSQPQFEEFIDELTRLPLKVFWSARLVSQTQMRNEREMFTPERVEELLGFDAVNQIGEITRWTSVLEGDLDILRSIAAARSQRKVVDGHTAGCSYEKLNPLAAAGINSCHEAISAEQVLDRLRLGMYVMLRDSSLRPDLGELIRVVTEKKVNTGRLILTTDGPSPDYITDNGCVDHLLEVVMSAGVDPITAIQMVTINPATYYRVDDRLGGIAPGRFADILFLTDLRSPRPDMVMANGEVVAWHGELVVDFPKLDWRKYRFDGPSLPPSLTIKPEHLMVPCEGDGVNLPLIDLVSAVITKRRDVVLPAKDGFVDITGQADLSYISLLDRHGQWVTNAVAAGFGRDVSGLASSYNTSCDILAIGSNSAAMARAVNRVFQLGGGIVLIDGEEIVFEFPLEIGGMMSERRYDDVADRCRTLATLLEERGHPYHDPLYTLLFLPSDFLPDVKITPAGVFDVKSRQVIYPARAI